MSLALDERRVAMLREMGLRLLPPLAAPPVEARGPAMAPDPGAPARSPERAEPALRAPVQPQQGDASAPPSAAPEVQHVAPGSRSWLVFCDSLGEGEAGADAGKLLDNMLRALGLDRERDVAVVSVEAARPGTEAQGESWLRHQLQLVQPRIVLAMGRFTIQTLLQTQEPVGKLRGRVHACQDVPVVVTYHPAYLLRNLADKAKAWADLCLAAGTAARPAQGGAIGS